MEAEDGALGAMAVNGDDQHQNEHQNGHQEDQQNEQQGHLLVTKEGIEEDDASKALAHEDQTIEELLGGTASFDHEMAPNQPSQTPDASQPSRENENGHRHGHGREGQRQSEHHPHEGLPTHAQRDETHEIIELSPLPPSNANRPRLADATRQATASAPNDVDRHHRQDRPHDQQMDEQQTNYHSQNGIVNDNTNGDGRWNINEHGANHALSPIDLRTPSPKVKAKAPNGQASNNREVLLVGDDDEDNENIGNTANASGMSNSDSPMVIHTQKRPRLEAAQPPANSHTGYEYNGSVKSNGHSQRAQNGHHPYGRQYDGGQAPNYRSSQVANPRLQIRPNQKPGKPIAHPSTRNLVYSPNQVSAVASVASASGSAFGNTQRGQTTTYCRNSNPIYFDLPPSFVPRWRDAVPRTPIQAQQQTHQQIRYFKLSLLSLSEFTISGVESNYDGQVSSTEGLGSTIRKLSKPYGKAVYDREAESGVDEGRWRIPLEAYNEFFAYLVQDPQIRVTGIPRQQLNIASLGKAERSKAYPSAKQLVRNGVPPRLATTLSPFQRGGVEFVMKKSGRALIADDMGLGKTIQAIASISMYHKEWPVLVLTPSSARYHWENEFQQWLGPGRADAARSTPDSLRDDGDDMDDDMSNVDKSKCMEPIRNDQIHVLTASKEKIFPKSTTKVVVCSYGLAPALVDQGKIIPGLFRCAIVDESHMLKNISTRRTSLLVPVLRATQRCLLLSGTPAFARPSELWPQLTILGTEKDGLWENKEQFYQNYVKNVTSERRAELHTLLTGTVMIRRLKSDILKTLPAKFREKAMLDVLTDETREEMHRLMIKLRQGKGVLGQLAQKHTALGNENEGDAGTAAETGKPAGVMDSTQLALDREYERRFAEGVERIKYTVGTSQTMMSDAEQRLFVEQATQDLRRTLDVQKKEELHSIHSNVNQDGDGESRVGTLNKMYGLTARCKIPTIVKLVEKWLSDPAKGKLCIFAHHLFVLDEIMEQVGLSNSYKSKKKYIRIDGSTAPKERQAQIKAFQEDPTIRIAVLGITAAGVAVTLTASSTVWFAELFWTTALMIQAEDRCHRIGQSTRVQCVYFVAEGTLDELLWALLEKKFMDLGEFVEGKEKQKLVVHKQYPTLQKFMSIFRTSADFDMGDEDGNDGDMSAVNAKPAAQKDDLNMLGILDFEKDLEQLAQVELGEIGNGDDSNEAMPQAAMNGDEGLLPSTDLPLDSPSAEAAAVGATENDAIELSDDEDDDVEVTDANGESGKPAANAGAALITHDGKFNYTAKLPNSRLYTVKFYGPRFGIELELFHGRLVVINRQGLDPTALKPTRGDIVVMINGITVPLTNSMQEASQCMTRFLNQGTVSLTFIDCPDFATHYAQVMQTKLSEMHANRGNGNRRIAATILPPASSAAGAPASRGQQDVIEILDDDDD